MNAQFWTRTGAAIGLAAVPLGLYYLFQNLPVFEGRVTLVAIVVLMFAAFLAPVLWVRRQENLNPVPEE